jgi:hypothetical protein
MTPQANLTGLSRRRIQFNPGSAQLHLITLSARRSMLGDRDSDLFRSLFRFELN